MMDIRRELSKATQAGKVLVLHLTRQPTDNERRFASVVVVRGQVVKSRHGLRGPWERVRKQVEEIGPLHEVRA